MKILVVLRESDMETIGFNINSTSGFEKMSKKIEVTYKKSGDSKKQKNSFDVYKYNTDITVNFLKIPSNIEVGIDDFVTSLHNVLFTDGGGYDYNYIVFHPKSGTLERQTNDVKKLEKKLSTDNKLKLSFYSINNDGLEKQGVEKLINVVKERIANKDGLRKKLYELKIYLSSYNAALKYVVGKENKNKQSSEVKNIFLDNYKENIDSMIKELNENKALKAIQEKLKETEGRQDLLEYIEGIITNIDEYIDNNEIYPAKY
jgi:hypothetical protein